MTPGLVWSRRLATCERGNVLHGPSVIAKVELLHCYPLHTAYPLPELAVPGVS
jgi:hypothetical protein